VVEHGGVMWADPLPGGGTRVSFCIPAQDGGTLDAPPVVAEPPVTPEPAETT
jgi:hypothetical protein